MADQIVSYEDFGLMGFGRVWELQKGLSRTIFFRPYEASYWT